MCKRICKKYKYFSYAFSTTGKRMLTLVDVVTDVRTFNIVNDAKVLVFLTCYLQVSLHQCWLLGYS